VARTERRRGRAPSARLIASLGVGLLLAAVLAGCAGIPQSGPIVVGRAVGDVPRAPLRISGSRPKSGAGPEEIVRGFLKAAADISGDRAVARLYLSGYRQTSWRADSSVVVYASDAQLTTRATPALGPVAPAPATAAGRAGAGPSATAAGTGSGTRAGAGATGTAAPRTGTEMIRSGSAPAPTTTPPVEGERVTVVVQVPVSARVNGDGEYRIAAPGDVERRVFGLVARSGQWRIDTLLDGSVLSRADFDTTYSNVPVFFPDPTGGWLVPDVRWFPIGAATATVLVKAVLSGPSPWLAPAVTTGAPPGTRLTAAAVPVQQGMATVDLTAEARKADPIHRQMLNAQLWNTLSMLNWISPTPVERVTITVDSKLFEIPKASDLVAVGGGRPGEPSQRLLLDPVVDGAPVVVDHEHLMRLSSGQLTAVPGLDALSGPTVSWPALATDGSAYAALSGGNRLVYALSGGHQVTLVTGLGPLSPPSFDPWGWVWTAAAGNVVRAGRPDKGAVPVAVEGWPAGLAISSLRISRDGTRAVVSGTRAGAGVLFVCAVLRDRAQVPVRLGPPQTLLPDLTSARGAAWLDQRRVVVLGARGTGPEQPWIVEIGGDAQPTPPAPGATSVTAGNGDIYVSTKEGILQFAVTTWVPVSTARWPAMAG
jgi:hypothetical protein